MIEEGIRFGAIGLFVIILILIKRALWKIKRANKPKSDINDMKDEYLEEGEYY